MEPPRRRENGRHCHVVRKSECEKLKVEIQRSRRQTDRRSIFCKSLIGFVPAVPVSLGLFEIDEPFSR